MCPPRGPLPGACAAPTPLLRPPLPAFRLAQVIDNNGKDLDSVGPVIDYAGRVSARQFLFISSAGIYKTSAEPPHIEGDAVKEDSGHALVEARLRDGMMAWSSFRPQYITGATRRRRRSSQPSRARRERAPLGLRSCAD